MGHLPTAERGARRDRRGRGGRGARLEITGEAGNDPRSYRVDFSRARKELGFEAGWTIPDGAEQLATEYRARGLTQDAFDNTFTRLAVLSRRQQAGELDESMRVLRP